MIQPLLCCVPYGLSWGWLDWLVLGVFFMVLIPGVYRGSVVVGEAEPKTHCCAVYKKIKTAQVLKNYLDGMLEDAYLVWFGFGSGFFCLFLQEFPWT